MSSTFAPFGLRDAYSPSGTLREMASTIASGYASDIYTGQPVKIALDGTLQAAGVGDSFIGVFAGCQYLPSGAQRPVVTPSWPANTNATQIVAYYTMDPSIVFEVQANGPVAQSNVGNQYNFGGISNSNGLGYSTAYIDTATATSSGSAQVRVVAIANGIDNAPGDSYTVVQVMISNHEYVATRNAF